MSLSLCGLQTGVMSVVAVADLDLAGAGDRKSLSGCFMCLNFSHFWFLLFVFLILRRLPIYHKISVYAEYYELKFCPVLLLLYGSYYHAQYPTVKHGRLIDASELCAGIAELLHDLLTDRDVTHLTALKAHDNTYLMTVLEEPLCMACLCFKVVGIDTAGKLYLLKLDGLLLLFGFLFLLVSLEAELAVVDYLTYGRLCLRSHKN